MVLLLTQTTYRTAFIRQYKMVAYMYQMAVVGSRANSGVKSSMPTISCSIMTSSLGAAASLRVLLDDDDDDGVDTGRRRRT
jgi:hypothetical protein